MRWVGEMSERESSALSIWAVESFKQFQEASQGLICSHMMCSKLIDLVQQ